MAPPAAVLAEGVEGDDVKRRWVKLLAWLVARSRAAQLALWLCAYAACCVAHFVATWAKDHSGEKVKELWRGDEDDDEDEEGAPCHP